MLCIDFNINACVLYTHIIKHIQTCFHLQTCIYETFIYNFIIYKIISTLTKKSLYHQVKYMGNYTLLFYGIVGFLNSNSFETRFPDH